MFLPTNVHQMPMDYRERQRIEEGRPATRAEITERSLRERHDLHIMESANVTDGDRPQRGNGPALTNGIDNARRTLSRWLISAGQHIGPKAA